MYVLSSHSHHYKIIGANNLFSACHATPSPQAALTPSPQAASMTNLNTDSAQSLTTPSPQAASIPRTTSTDTDSALTTPSPQAACSMTRTTSTDTDSALATPSPQAASMTTLNTDSVQSLSRLSVPSSHSVRREHFPLAAGSVALGSSNSDACTPLVLIPTLPHSLGLDGELRVSVSGNGKGSLRHHD